MQPASVDAEQIDQVDDRQNRDETGYDQDRRRRNEPGIEAAAGALLEKNHCAGRAGTGGENTKGDCELDAHGCYMGCCNGIDSGIPYHYGPRSERGAARRRVRRH